MSLPFTGTFTRSKGFISAVEKELRTLSLKPVKKITVQFDPFGYSTETRCFLFQLTTPKIRMTNPSCLVKTEIFCDRSEPKVICNLTNGDNVVFKSQNLTILDILKLFNKHITVLAPPKEEISEVKTKIGKIARKK